MTQQVSTEQAPRGVQPPPPPSVEERAAALFSDAPRKVQGPPPEPVESTDAEEATAPTAELTERPSEATTGDEPTADETFEFEHEGETWTIPKKLEKVIQNNRDYTQKSQEIAHQRRTFEALNEQAKLFSAQREFESSISQELQQLAAYDSVLNQKVEWGSISNDEALKLTLQRNQWKDEREAIAKSIQAKHQEHTQKQQEALKELQTKALETVSKRIPGWNDALWTAIRDHAKSDGYTDVELNSINDPRHKVTLWKAQQYDNLRAKATKTVPETRAIKTNPSNPMPQHVKDKLKIRKAMQKTAPNSPERKELIQQRIANIFAAK